jgi:uncharacterized membrane protein YbhN (UPF0104 family)
VVPSLAVTETRIGRRSTRTFRVEQVLLVLALLALAASVVFGFVPVDNPGVQSCGSPFVFSWRVTNDVILPGDGSPSAPPDVDQLRAQAPCHQRVDRRLILAGLAFAASVALGLLGAILGLIDDRNRYRAAPRFESYLRERPPDAPADPWDRPVVPESDLGERLPDIEWREVRVVVGVSLLVTAVLVWLATWSRVHRALEHLSIGWIIGAVVLVLFTYPVAAAAVTMAGDDDRDGAPSFASTLATAVASSFTGRLLPEYGAAGLAAHRLVRAGIPRVAATRQLAVVDSVAVIAHTAMLVVVGLVAWSAGPAAGVGIRAQWLVWAFVAVMVLVGLLDAPRRYRTLVIRPGRRAFVVDGAFAPEPVRLIAITLACIVLALLNAMVVLVAAHAFGGQPSAAAALAVGLAAAAAVVVAPTPDGVGLVEPVLVLGLIWAGVGGGVAVAAMVLVRVVGFWLPMLPGGFALRRLRRDGTL